MKNLKLFTFLLLGIALASCKKETVKPATIPIAKHDVDVSFKIYPEDDYAGIKFDNFGYDDVMVRVRVGIEKMNKKTGRTEMLLDSLLPVKKLRDYKLPFDTIRINKKIKDVIEGNESIVFSHYLQYYEGNRNLSSSSTWSPLEDFIKTKEIKLGI
jgi:hypothetical protein